MDSGVIVPETIALVAVPRKIPLNELRSIASLTLRIVGEETEPGALRFATRSFESNPIISSEYPRPEIRPMKVLNVRPAFSVYPT